MNNSLRKKTTPAYKNILCCTFSTGRITQILKPLIITLFFFAVVSLNSCKTCKCPAYSYHPAGIENADATAADVLYKNNFRQIEGSSYNY